MIIFLIINKIESQSLVVAQLLGLGSLAPLSPRYFITFLPPYPTLFFNISITLILFMKNGN